MCIGLRRAPSEDEIQQFESVEEAPYPLTKIESGALIINYFPYLTIAAVNFSVSWNK